ncbi:transaldolase [bacterium A37T11]|nr:transaldolase [bacterium A37T11]
MEANKIKKIHDFGQSIWLDFIDRHILQTGQLQKLITDDGIRGLTSNPAIFEKAISGSDDYNDDIAALSKEGYTDEDLFFELAIKDIRAAADLLYPIYNDEEIKGADGYVSLEVSPFLALDTAGTIAQAKHLWEKVERDNVMIKIPGTQPGLSAIKQAIAAGININVTLLFGLNRYREVVNVYLEGLEERLAKGEPIEGIASVASFFLSRIDVLIDPLLEEKGLPDLKGKVAIASAKKAYEIYKELFSGPRWDKLAAAGAHPQRLLWASTSSKNPDYPDTKYVDALIGPNTVDTVPMETLDAYRDHGDPADRLESNTEEATEVLDQLEGARISLDALTQQLEDEGIKKFNEPFHKLLASIAAHR